MVFRGFAQKVEYHPRGQWVDFSDPFYNS